MGFEFLDAESGGSAAVKVVGIGGAGMNAVVYMQRKDIGGMEFVVMNTDEQALRHSTCPNKVLFKQDGRGEGQPWLARRAARNSREEIEQALCGARMVVLVAGLGGHCGTGCTPVVARIAKEAGAFVVCVVTLPFQFEGHKRTERAREGLEDLLRVADNVIVAPNDALVEMMGQTLSMNEYFDLSNEAMYHGVRCVSGLNNEQALVPVNFADLRMLLRGAGMARFGSLQYARGGSALEAARAMVESPLVNAGLLDAESILLSFDLPVAAGVRDVDDALGLLRGAVRPETQILPCARIDESLENAVRITVIATGFTMGHGDEVVFQILEL